MEVIMANEVEKTKDEADWALDYAAENRRRVKAEHRLKGLMGASAALCTVLDTLINESLKPASKNGELRLIKALAKCAMEQLDVEYCLHLNTFDPAWGIKPEIQDALARGAQNELQFRQYFKEQSRMMSNSFDELMKEWKLVCMEHNLNDPDQVREERRTEFAMKALAKGLSNRTFMEAITGEQHGEEQAAEKS
jgi:hypothetical protein